MTRLSLLFASAAALVLVYAGVAGAQQYPIMERVAQKVIQKYQSASCEELAQQRAHPPTGQKAQVEQRVIQLLRDDPQMRAAFIARVAAPIANKLFECGMIP